MIPASISVRFARLSAFLEGEIQHLIGPRPQRILFDHLPKCAGTTINQHLSRHYSARFTFHTNPDRPHESVRDFMALPKGARHRFRLIHGHQCHRLIPYVHPDSIVATVLRDPIDRIISHYHYVKARPRHYLYERVSRDSIDLANYARAEISEELENYYTCRFSGLSAEQACRAGSEGVELAFAFVTEKYDIVGFQDNLDEFINALCDRGGLNKSFRNWRRNQTERPPSPISSDVRSSIAASNRLDLELFARLRAVYLQ